MNITLRTALRALAVRGRTHRRYGIGRDKPDSPWCTGLEAMERPAPGQQTIRL
jgi:hypothetical protein